MDIKQNKPADNSTAIPVRIDNRIPKSEELINLEIEHNIPVKDHPEGTPQKSASEPNPIASKQQSSEDKKDIELEHVLEDVNQKVKEESQEDNPNKSKLRGRLFAKTKLTKNTKAIKKPILATLAAILVSGGLTAAAIYTFNQDTKESNKANFTNTAKAEADSFVPGKVISGTELNPGDLTDLATSLENDTKAMNNEQDFNTDELSDHNLGLE